MTTNPPSSAAIFDDAEYVRLSLAGNRKAFEKIVAQYQSLICSLTYSATGSLRESEDVAQETFLIAWRRLKELREAEKLRPWLCGIARHLISRTLRRREREPTHGATSLEDVQGLRAPEATPSETAMNREEAALLWRSLERIPDLYREPLILFYREHHSTERVAAALDLSEETARQRLSRGRKLLHDEVVAFVEGSLKRSAPGLPFTAGVLSALPIVTTSTSVAALATTGKGGGIFKTAALGWGAPFLAPLASLFGSYLGYRATMNSLQSEGDRWWLRKVMLRTVISGLIAMGILIPLMIYGGGFMVRLHPWVFVTFLSSLLAAFVALQLGLMAWGKRQRERNAALVLLNPSFSPMKMRVSFSYRSRISFLGLPLVNLQFVDDKTKKQETVRGWIAGGGRAIGGLFAFSHGVAIAPFAIGSVAVGGVAVGGLAVGLFAVGPFALGGLVCGGFAEGWKAAGGLVVGWKAAIGGWAVAREFALGANIHALHARDTAAHQFFRQDIFFRTFLTRGPYLCSGACMVMFVAQAIWKWRVGPSQARALPKEIALTSEEAAEYVGRFGEDPQAYSVTQAGRRLTVQFAQFPPARIFRSGKDDFYLKVVDVRITFERSSDGKIKGLVSRLNGGAERRANKNNPAPESKA